MIKIKNIRIGDCRACRPIIRSVMLFQHDAKMILSMIVSVVGTPVVDSLHAEKTYKKNSLKDRFGWTHHWPLPICIKKNRGIVYRI